MATRIPPLNSTHEENSQIPQTPLEIPPSRDTRETDALTGYPPRPASFFSADSKVAWLATEFNKSLTLAYDYAISGATLDTQSFNDGTIVRGYMEQVTEDFIPFAGEKRDTTWTSEDSLFSMFPRAQGTSINGSLVDWDQ